MTESKIEWTESTWNPTTGCTKLSAGCENCYAEVMALRLKAMGQKKYRNGFELTLHPEALAEPYKWKKSRMVFVNSMSDLFHQDVPIDFIRKVFQVIKENPHHIFQVLTKRADILEEYDRQDFIEWHPNLWMGVTVENTNTIGRIDYLRNTRAKVKFLSCEPLFEKLGTINLDGIDWVIVCGESGPKARPIKEEWIEDIKHQCTDYKVPFYFKQWGGKN